MAFPESYGLSSTWIPMIRTLCFYSVENIQTTSNEYSCAVTPQVRQTGNRLSGLAGTAYASLLT